LKNEPSPYYFKEIELPSRTIPETILNLATSSIHDVDSSERKTKLRGNINTWRLRKTESAPCGKDNDSGRRKKSGKEEFREWYYA
jgi:hypothetical protein